MSGVVRVKYDLLRWVSRAIGRRFTSLFAIILPFASLHPDIVSAQFLEDAGTRTFPGAGKYELRPIPPKYLRLLEKCREKSTHHRAGKGFSKSGPVDVYFETDREEIKKYGDDIYAEHITVGCIFSYDKRFVRSLGRFSLFPPGDITVEKGSRISGAGYRGISLDSHKMLVPIDPLYWTGSGNNQKIYFLEFVGNVPEGWYPFPKSYSLSLVPDYLKFVPIQRGKLHGFLSILCMGFTYKSKISEYRCHKGETFFSPFRENYKPRSSFTPVASTYPANVIQFWGRNGLVLMSMTRQTIRGCLERLKKPKQSRSPLWLNYVCLQLSNDLKELEWLPPLKRSGR